MHGVCGRQQGRSHFPLGEKLQTAGAPRDRETSAGREVTLSAGSASGVPETELQPGAPSAHPTQNGTVTTNSPVTAADTHETDPETDPASSCPPHEKENRKGRNEQFNIDFIQINLNKSKSATGDLAIFTKNKDKPILLVQEPHVNGKNVLSRVSPCLKAIASRTKETRPRACIFHHISMSRQLWPKDSFTTGDCAIIQIYVHYMYMIFDYLKRNKNTLIGSFPLKIETTSEVYVEDFGLHISRLHYHNCTP